MPGGKNKTLLFGTYKHQRTFYKARIRAKMIGMVNKLRNQGVKICRKTQDSKKFP